MTEKMSMNVSAQIATEWVTTTRAKLRTGNGRRVKNIELTNISGVLVSIIDADLYHEGAIMTFRPFSYIVI